MTIAVTIYEDTNLKGSKKNINYGENYAHLSDIDWNDKVSSVVVANGYYVDIYQDADYGGDKKAMIPGTYNDLHDYDWNDRISSIKSHTRCAAIIYTDSNYKGNSIIVPGNIMNLDDIGFNDRITSIQVKPGYQVTFYTDSNFGGKSITYDHDTSNVGDDWNDKFSSIKVTYTFGAEVFSGADFNGQNKQLPQGKYNTKDIKDLGGKILALKVSPGYKVKVFAGENCTGASCEYLGPCDITNVNPGASISIESYYAVRAFDGNGCTGASIDFSTSVASLEAYGWKDRISSLMVDENFLVQIWKDANYQDDSIMVAPVNGRVDFSGDLTDWNNEVSSIRIINKNIPAVYLFEDGHYGAECVRLINNGDSKTHNWYWDGDDGKKNDIGNDELSSVIIVGNYQVTLYEDSDKDDGNCLVLHGPGCFDLTAKATEDALDKEIFQNMTTKINIASYTPHRGVLSNVRGYSGLILLRGDLHNHTLWSDAYWGGKGGIHYIDDPKQTFRIYQDLGWDFDGIADHLFGLDEHGHPRYTTGAPRSIPGMEPKYALAPDEWGKTNEEADRPEHNYNFSAIAGYEYGLGGVKYEVEHKGNDPEMVAHYNVFGTKTLYYGQPGLWHNTSDSRKDFYRWGAEEYKKNPDVIIQFNHPSDDGKGFYDFDIKEAPVEGGQPYTKPFKLLEVYSVSGDGDDKDWLVAYEKALKAGWKVGPTATSDNHDGIKSLKVIYENIRTVVAAKESAKDSVLAALRERRVYATRIPGLDIGFSITNSSGQTALMGSDIMKFSTSLAVDVGISGELGSNSITSVELHTGTTEPIVIFNNTNKTWPIFIPYTLSVSQQNSIHYLFVVVKSDQKHVAITAPIWIMA
ncbi:MAG TPA: beta/gamma crystallin-related protein [Bacillota bacterium]|nr:beta/gamma crystallin-related protein [Bacillota bacterium]